MSVEGHYRLISHNERAEAIYARLGELTGAIEWVRNWREATTFLTIESAQLARDAARMEESAREIDIAQRFKDWKASKPRPAPKSGKVKRAKKATAMKRAEAKTPVADATTAVGAETGESLSSAPTPATSAPTEGASA